MMVSEPSQVDTLRPESSRHMAAIWVVRDSSMDHGCRMAVSRGTKKRGCHVMRTGRLRFWGRPLTLLSLLSEGLYLYYLEVQLYTDCEADHGVVRLQVS